MYDVVAVPADVYEWDDDDHGNPEVYTQCAEAIRSIRQKVQPLREVYSQDCVKVHDMKELLEEIQGTVDALREAHAGKDNTNDNSSSDSKKKVTLVDAEKNVDDDEENAKHSDNSNTTNQPAIHDQVIRQGQHSMLALSTHKLLPIHEADSSHDTTSEQQTASHHSSIHQNKCSTSKDVLRVETTHNPKNDLPPDTPEEMNDADDTLVGREVLVFPEHKRNTGTLCKRKSACEMMCQIQ